MSDEWKSADELAKTINQAFTAFKAAMNVIVTQELEKVNRMKETVEALEKQQKERKKWAAEKASGNQQP